MAQHDLSAAGRRKLASKGVARGDGSYPISDQEDVAKAVKDWARTGRTGAVKAWITKRVRALDLEMPAEFSNDGDGDEMSFAKKHTGK